MSKSKSKKTTEQEPLPIHDGKNSSKIIKFAKDGNGMSDVWWKETHRLNNNGRLEGIYKTPSGLRRNVK